MHVVSSIPISRGAYLSAQPHIATRRQGKTLNSVSALQYFHNLFYHTSTFMVQFLHGPCDAYRLWPSYHLKWRFVPQSRTRSTLRSCKLWATWWNSCWYVSVLCVLIYVLCAFTNTASSETFSLMVSWGHTMLALREANIPWYQNYMNFYTQRSKNKWSEYLFLGSLTSVKISPRKKELHSRRLSLQTLRSWSETELRVLTESSTSKVPLPLFTPPVLKQ